MQSHHEIQPDKNWLLIWIRFKISQFELGSRGLCVCVCWRWICRSYKSESLSGSNHFFWKQKNFEKYLLLRAHLSESDIWPLWSFFSLISYSIQIFPPECYFTNSYTVITLLYYKVWILMWCPLIIIISSYKVWKRPPRSFLHGSWRDFPTESVGNSFWNPDFDSVSEHQW